MNNKRRPQAEETLARLGIAELEERMEVSPVLAGGELQNLDRPDRLETDWTCCTCKVQPDPPQPSEPGPPLPGPEG
jgi:hypothetical protein